VWGMGKGGAGMEPSQPCVGVVFPTVPRASRSKIQLTEKRKIWTKALQWAEYHELSSNFRCMQDCGYVECRLNMLVSHGTT
jgi:hypothetical protein